MIYEDAALAKHPAAREFRPVKRSPLGGALIGWTFEVRGSTKGDTTYGLRYGWVTVDGEASSDLTRDRAMARCNLRVYAGSRPARSNPGGVPS